MRDLMTSPMRLGYRMALEDVEQILVRYVGPLNLIRIEFEALKKALKEDEFDIGQV